MWKFLVAVALFMHGVGHIAGFLSAWTTVNAGFADRPWIFSSGVTIKSPVGRAFGLLWLVALICLAAAGIGLLFGQEWWPVLAMVGAAISLLAIVPWWNTVVSGAKAGALFDLLILVALLSPWKEQIVQALS